MKDFLLKKIQKKGFQTRRNSKKPDKYLNVIQKISGVI